MNYDKFLVFVQKNIEYFQKDDIKLIIEGKYFTLFDKFKKRVLIEKDRKKKDKLYNILIYFSEFFHDYKKKAYRYQYIKSEKPDHFMYWFNFYFSNKLIKKAEEVVFDMKKKFPNYKSIEKLEKKINRNKKEYENELNEIKINVEKNNKLKYIERLMWEWNYWFAMSEILRFIQDYPEDKFIWKYIKKIDMLKSNNLVENIEISKNYFEKVWLLSLTKKSELKWSDLGEIYKKLDLLFKKKDYEWWLSLIKYIKEKFSIDDLKLLKYRTKFNELNKKKQQIKQKEEYNLEYKSLKMLLKNNQLEEALIKANTILKKYPLISKKEILSIVRRIKIRKDEIFKKKDTKTKIDLFFENLMNKLNSLNKKWLYQFYQKMSWFLNAKMDLKLSLQVIFFQTKDSWLKRFIKDILDGIDSGMKLSEVMKWYDIVWKLDVSLIKIWESTWKLWDMFNTIAITYKENNERKKKIKGVMIYPSIIICVTILIFIWLLVFIIPKFVTLFEQVNMKLPFITQLMINMSNFIREKWYIVIAWIIWIILFYITFNQTRTWKYFFSHISLRIPVMKEMLKKKYIIFFSWNLGMLLKSWINLLEALDLIIYWTDNLLFQDEFKRIRFELETWISFSKSVWLWSISEVWNYHNNYVPIDLAYAIDVWERTWQLWDLLLEVSKRYDDDLKVMIKNLQSLMEPFIIILVWWIIFMFVVSVFLPMVQMYNVIWKL